MTDTTPSVAPQQPTKRPRSPTDDGDLAEMSDSQQSKRLKTADDTVPALPPDSAVQTHKRKASGELELAEPAEKRAKFEITPSQGEPASEPASESAPACLGDVGEHDSSHQEVENKHLDQVEETKATATATATTTTTATAKQLGNMDNSHAQPTAETVHSEQSSDAVPATSSSQAEEPITQPSASSRETLASFQADKATPVAHNVGQSSHATVDGAVGTVPPHPTAGEQANDTAVVASTAAGATPQQTGATQQPSLVQTDTAVSQAGAAAAAAPQEMEKEQPDHAQAERSVDNGDETETKGPADHADQTTPARAGETEGEGEQASKGADDEAHGTDTSKRANDEGQGTGTSKGANDGEATEARAQTAQGANDGTSAQSNPPTGRGGRGGRRDRRGRGARRNQHRGSRAEHVERGKPFPPGEIRLPLILLGTGQRRYADSVEAQLHSDGIVVDTRYLGGEPLAKVVDDLFMSGHNVLLVVGKDNERNGSVSLRIFHIRDGGTVGHTSYATNLRDTAACVRELGSPPSPPRPQSSVGPPVRNQLPAHLRSRAAQNGGGRPVSRRGGGWGAGPQSHGRGDRWITAETWRPTGPAVGQGPPMMDGRGGRAPAHRDYGPPRGSYRDAYSRPIPDPYPQAPYRDPPEHYNAARRTRSRSPGGRSRYGAPARDPARDYGAPAWGGGHAMPPRHREYRDPRVPPPEAHYRRPPTQDPPPPHSAHVPPPRYSGRQPEPYPYPNPARPVDNRYTDNNPRDPRSLRDPRRPEPSYSAPPPVDTAAPDAADMNVSAIMSLLNDLESTVSGASSDPYAALPAMHSTGYREGQDSQSYIDPRHSSEPAREGHSHRSGRLPESYSQHTPRGADYGQPRGPPGDRRGSVSAGTGYGGYRGVETGRNYASYHSGSLGSGGQGGFGRDGAHHGESGQSPHPSYAAPPQPNPAGASVGNWPQRRSDPRMAGRY